MNTWIGMGRLVRDPQTRAYGENNDKKMARFTVACDKYGKHEEGQQTADFIGCICYGKQADYVDQYLRQGTKVAIMGAITTGKYTDKDGKTVYTTDVLVNRIEFAESKRPAEQTAPAQSEAPAPGMVKKDESWMNIPQGVEEQLPWD